jgi:haloalkane dehalogenase
MIPPLTAAGYRVIAMDHLGFGRSDKPTEPSSYTFEVHRSRLREFVRQLNLKGATAFVQDWGSVLGLWLLSEEPDLFSRVILGNGGIPVVTAVATLPADPKAAAAEFDRLLSSIPDQQPAFFDDKGKLLLPSGSGAPEGQAAGFGQWIVYARDFEGFEPSRMVEALTYRALTPDERAAYDAPCPSRIYLAGPRTFPGLLNDLVGTSAARKEGLKAFKGPFLTLFGGNDPGLAGDDTQEWMQANLTGAANQPHHRYQDASHFLQDDQGADLARRVDEFIKATK